MISREEKIEAVARKLFTRVESGHLSDDAGREPVFFVDCPGRHLHSTSNRDTDACIRYSSSEHPPGVYCFHQQCREERAVTNSALRAMLRHEKVITGKQRNKKRTPEQQQFQQIQLAARVIEAKFPNLFKTLDDSFFKGRLGLPESRERLFALHEPDDIIWNGEEYQSGDPRGYGRFQTIAYWREAPLRSFGSFTAPGVFKVGEISRKKANLLKPPRYFVIEFDRLDPDPNINQIKSWFLMQWLCKAYNLRVVLCVDSGNKSLHFWVEITPNVTLFVINILKALGAERPILTDGAHAVRFPGVIRDKTNRPQCVIEFKTL